MAESELTKAQDRTNQQLKIVLLGDGTTGKTSIATRLAQSGFDRDYHQTLGVDFFLRRIELPGGVNVALQIWDIGGQTIGGQMLDNYIFGADAVLLIYDITNYSSFQNLHEWLKVVNKVFAQSDRSPHLALVANKSDLEAFRTVKREKHHTFSSKFNTSSFYVSAKTDDLVGQCLMQVAANVLKITLTHKDLDTSNKVIKAEIMPAAESSSVVIQNKRGKNTRTSSAICAIQ